MSSKLAAVRTLYTPNSNFNQRKIPITSQPQRGWYRVHRSGVSALEFAIRRHHRFSHASCPFSILYLGGNIATCLWEYFGDDVFGKQRVISAAKWNGCSLSRIEVPPLKACAINHMATRDAMGLDKASLLASDLSIPQAWGLAVQQHPEALEGIKYSGRFVDQPCLALFERDGMATRVRELLIGQLNEVDAALDWLDQRDAGLV